eukprot:Tbor_TRINITY_DN3073_c0_g1::TRINITY_DN3073_c0_g1_i1::g.17418::m.17418/K04798/pfdB, PFDN6; prefoldin beta subunit
MTTQIHPDIRKMYEQVQVMLKEVEEIRTKKTKLIETQHQLGAQKNENTLVREELDTVEEGASVYKLIGPVLVSQDTVDAKTIVEKRLEYINDQIKRTDASISQCDTKEGEVIAKILATQQKMEVRQKEIMAAQQPVKE